MNKINYPDYEFFNRNSSDHLYFKSDFLSSLSFKDLVKIGLYSICLSIKYINSSRFPDIFNNIKEFISLIKIYLKSESSIIEYNTQILDQIYPRSFIQHNSVYQSSEWFYWTAFYMYNIFKTHNNCSEIRFALSWAINCIANKELKNILEFLKMILRKEKQFNILEHNNTPYEKIIKEIIKCDIDNFEEFYLFQLKDLVEENYNIEIDLNMDKRIIIETLRREYEYN